MNARELSRADIRAVAEDLGVAPCAVEAVVRVESAGSGFLPDGRPKILFEGHIFWKELAKAGGDPQRHAAAHPGILSPTWTGRHYRGGGAEYLRLREAESLHREAALRSASWGAFQIMGFNHARCGFADVSAFVEAQASGAAAQLRAFAAFLRAERLSDFLRRRDWAGFARKYNGPGYAKNRYDTRLAEAYERCRAGEGAATGAAIGASPPAGAAS